MDRHGLTLLHIAAMRNHEACVQALIDSGFGVKLKSSSGWLPYQEAAAYRSSRALTTILVRHTQPLPESLYMLFRSSGDHAWIVVPFKHPAKDSAVQRAHKQVFESNTRLKLQKLQNIFADMPDCAFQVCFRHYVYMTSN